MIFVILNVLAVNSSVWYYEADMNNAANHFVVFSIYNTIYMNFFNAAIIFSNL